MSPQRTSPHPSELALHAHLLGALAPRETAQVEQHAGGCQRCQEALNALGQGQERFARGVLARTLPAVRARGPRPPTPSHGHSRRRWLAWLGLALPAAAAGGVALRLGARTAAQANAEDLLPKGVAPAAAELEVFAYREGEVFRAFPHMTRLRAGDEIRFVVRRPERLPYVMIAALDGAGVASLYYPYGGHHSALLAEDETRLELPGSIVLDSSPGPERIFALFSRQPLAFAAVERALQALSGPTPSLPTGEPLLAAAEAQASVLFEKE